MNGVETAFIVSSGFNLLVLGAILLNNYRIGKIEGVMKNGGYLKCPFYRGTVQSIASKKCGKGNKG